MRASGEPPLSGLTISIYSNGTLIGQQVTGPDRVYNFTGLRGGTHVWTTKLVPGFRPRTPEILGVTVAFGDDRNDVHFWFYPSPHRRQ